MTTVSIEVKKSQHKYVIGPKGHVLQEILASTGEKNLTKRRYVFLLVCAVRNIVMFSLGNYLQRCLSCQHDCECLAEKTPIGGFHQAFFLLN